MMAGVPNIVATWWPLVDRITINVTRSFYESLRTDYGLIDAGRTARALPAAPDELQTRERSAYVLCVYAHFGV
jgi:CHAT domain-containing protein